MGELAIVIPAPIAEDPENVVTALETAAEFGSKGNASEALRWVRNAAASAGESGCDLRAFDLARAAADLTPTPPELAVAPRSLPTPPARPSALGRDSERAPSSMRPPPPSASRSPAPTSRPPSANGPSAIRSSEAPRAPANVAPRASQAPRPWPTRSERVPLVPRAAAAPNPEPAARPVTAPRSEALRNESLRNEAPQSEPLSGRRAAARVSVTRGDDPGVFVVRMLEEGAAPPGESLEAYLVLVDPSAQLSPQA